MLVPLLRFSEVNLDCGRVGGLIEKYWSCSANAMNRGYLNVRTCDEILSDTVHRNFEKCDLFQWLGSSPESKGWIPLTSAIRDGNCFNVSAEQNGVCYKAVIQTNNPSSVQNNGTCEIRGGPLACRGTFMSLWRVNPESEFKFFFECYSRTHDPMASNLGPEQQPQIVLRWWIGIIEFVDSANPTPEV